MAITQALCNSFKSELMTAGHNFDVGGSSFNIALYTSAATLGANTTAYTPTNEVTGIAYVAGGETLINIGVTLSSGIAFTDFTDMTWANSTITARGAMIYNVSLGGNSVGVLDFGSDRSSNAGDFTIVFPPADNVNAIIRIT